LWVVPLVVDIAPKFNIDHPNWWRRKPAFMVDYMPEK
jgi:hypothetical protein